MNLQEMVRLNAELYSIRYQSTLDNKAYWVDQREVGFINEQDINSGIKIGTNNVQQCVVVMISGNRSAAAHSGELLADLIHFDKFTDPAEITSVFTNFSTDNLRVTLYGSRDISQQGISHDNAETVKGILGTLGINYAAQYLEDPTISSEVIFDPLKNVIEQNIYSALGSDTIPIRVSDRKIDDIEKHHDNQSNEIIANRDSKLRVVYLEQCIELAMFTEHYYTKEIAKKYLANYCTQYETYITEFDDWYRNHPTSLPSYCYTSFQPLIEGAYYAQGYLGFNTPKKDMYNGVAIAQLVNPDQHLKRTGKAILSQDGEPYNMRESFAAANVNSELLSRLEKESIITAKDTNLEAINNDKEAKGKIGSVRFLAEHNHETEHAGNIQFLIDGIKYDKNYKGSDQYNRIREEYMAGRINELTSKGYNVIAHVGSAHVKNLQQNIENSTLIKNKQNIQPIQTIKEQAKNVGKKLVPHVVKSRAGSNISAPVPKIARQSGHDI